MFILEKLKDKGLILALITWGVYFIFLWPRMLSWASDGIRAGWVGVWGDWSAHFSYASVFAFRPITQWFTSHPLFFSHKFGYPFLADAISGLLWRLGLNEVSAFIFPSIITTIFLLIVLYFFYARFLKSAGQAFLALTLFLTNGGLGFWWFIKDFLGNPSLGTLAFPPQEYTHLTEQAIEWINIVSSELIPQRSFLLGLPIALILIIILFHWFEKNFEAVSSVKLAVFGALASLMLFIHVHSYLALIIFSAVLFATSLRHWRKWLVLAAGAAIPSFVIYNAFYGGQGGLDFLKWYPGWLANPAAHNLNFIKFLLLNWGLFLPLALVAIWRTKFYKHPLVIGGIVIFILAHLFLFQPFNWDNTKLLTWSYLVLIIPVTHYLAEIWKKNLLLKFVVVGLFILMTASGFLDLWRLTRTEKLANLMWSREELALAEEFRELSQPTDRVFVSDKHNHWVSTLTGRQIILGYKGWAWTYGIDYGPLTRDSRLMFAGGDEAEELLKQYGVSFAVIDQSAVSDYQANEEFFRSRYPLVQTSRDYRVYKIIP